MCMGRKEVLNRLAAGELPSTLSREAWERKLQYIEIYKAEIIDHVPCGECALCISCRDCDDCSLFIVDNGCGNRGAYGAVMRATNNTDLVSTTKHLIEVLKKVEEWERKKREEE